MNACPADHWNSATLGDLALEIRNGLPEKPHPEPPGNPILRISAVRPGKVDFSDLRYHRSAQSSAGYVVNRGDLLIVRYNGNARFVAACGMVRDSVDGCVYPDKLIRVRIDPSQALPEYIELAMLTPESRRQLEPFIKTAAGQHGISAKDLRRLRIRLPPLAEQRRIVARIEALFARTRRARTDLERIAPLSERHRLAHLRAGVTGQLTEAWRQKHPAEDVRMTLRRIPAPEQGRGGRDATTDVTPGMAALSVNDPGTLAPPGWAWTPLLRVARQETGHTPSRRVPAYWDGGDVPWVGIRDAGAHHGTTIYDTMQKCTELGLANSSARLLPAGTVCLSRTASVGYVTVLGKSMATSQDFATWTCTPALLPEYLKFALLAEGDDIRRFGEGSTHTTIYFPEIKALHICLPPVEEQAEIVRILTSNAGGQTIASAEAASTLALLNRLEQSILSRAFSGELVPQGSHEAPGSASTANPHSAAPEPRRGRPKAGIAA